MQIFKYEIKKILVSPAIIISVVICAAFNLFNYFAYGLAPLETAEPSNVFENYSTDYIAEAYIDGLSLNGTVAENMREKYAAMQSVVGQKALDGDSFGQYTGWQHADIFGDSMTILLLEGITIAALIMLLILGHEHINRTELTVYSSKTGRRITRHKLAAALTATLGAFALLAAAAIIPLFIAHPDLWQHNISSAFNEYIYDLFAGHRPFVTWHSFTVLEYLWAVIAVSAGIVLCFSLASYAIGTTIRNSYIGFVVLFLLTIFSIFITFLIPYNSYPAFILAYLPTYLTLHLPMWFTDGGMNYLWSNFEIWGTSTSLLILLITAAFTTIKFKRRDIL